MFKQKMHRQQKIKTEKCKKVKIKIIKRRKNTHEKTNTKKNQQQTNNPPPKKNPQKQQLKEVMKYICNTIHRLILCKLNTVTYQYFNILIIFWIFL